jgi:hypothetical protein
MEKAISTQHPAVVLRSHFRIVRALLIVAMIAVAGLSAAVVIVANDDDVAGTSSASPAGSINYGGFNPATGRPESAPLPQTQAPDAPAPAEGTGGPAKDYSMNSATGEVAPVPSQAPDTRHGGPQEGTRGPGFNTD